jgi:hypothetical protein
VRTQEDCVAGRKARDSRTLATKDEQHHLITKCHLLGFDSLPVHLLLTAAHARLQVRSVPESEEAKQIVERYGSALAAARGGPRSRRVPSARHRERRLWTPRSRPLPNPVR